MKSKKTGQPVKTGAANIDRVIEANAQLQAKEGPVYEKWKRNLNKALKG